MEIRRATVDDARALAEVHVASWRETYSGLMPDSLMRRLSVDDRAVRWARMLDRAQDNGGAFAFIAEQGGEPVGFASGSEQRDEALLAQGLTGELTAIYILRKAQRQGLGARLVSAVAQHLHDQGYSGASLWVLRNNEPARRFYERCSGQLVGEKEEQRDGFVIAEVAYGWRDLRDLIAALRVPSAAR